MARRRGAFSADEQALLARLERLSRLLDEQFLFPGTNVRVGLDAIIGLIPGVGDLLTGGLALYLFFLARRFGLPAHVQARMLANIGIDMAFGSVPLLGDAFDVAFRANRRNLRLLLQHLERRRTPGGGPRTKGDGALGRN